MTKSGTDLFVGINGEGKEIRKTLHPTKGWRFYKTEPKSLRKAREKAKFESALASASKALFG